MLGPPRATPAAELLEQIGEATTLRARTPTAPSKHVVQIVDVKGIRLRPAARRVSPAARVAARAGRFEIAAKLVIAFSFVGIAQHFERRLDLLKLFFRTRIIW